MEYRSCIAYRGLLAAGALVCFSSPAMAYVGPGAGVEFIGYFFTLLAWVGAAFFSIMLWPLYSLVRRARGHKPKDTNQSQVPAELAAPDEVPAERIKATGAEATRPIELSGPDQPVK